jgi:hypothetical protein
MTKFIIPAQAGIQIEIYSPKKSYYPQSGNSSFAMWKERAFKLDTGLRRYDERFY